MSVGTCQGCGAVLPPSKSLSRARKWCSERCRKASYGDPCVDCGARTGFGAQKARVAEPRCIACARARRSEEAEAGYQLIRELRAEGMLNMEIAKTLGLSETSVTNLIYRARTQGIEIAPSPWYYKGRREAA